MIWREIGIPLPQNYIESGIDGLQDMMPGVCEFIDSNGDQCAGELSTGSIYCFAHKYTVRFDDAQKKPSFTPKKSSTSKRTGGGILESLAGGSPPPPQRPQSSSSFYNTHNYRCFCGHVQNFDRPQGSPRCPSCGKGMWRN